MNTNFPTDLHYSEEHAWVRRESSGKVVTIGATAFAVESLGTITQILLPSHEGEVVRKHAVFGSIANRNADSSLFMPVSGKIVNVNASLASSPATLGDDCYGKGWMITVEMTEPNDFKDLLSVEAYRAYLSRD